MPADPDQRPLQIATGIDKPAPAGLWLLLRQQGQQGGQAIADGVGRAYVHQRRYRVAGERFVADQAGAVGIAAAQAGTGDGALVGIGQADGRVTVVGGSLHDQLVVVGNGAGTGEKHEQQAIG